ncbi:MAG: hypothetical protein R2941_23125 [Desulfobacterales bacterium]
MTEDSIQEDRELAEKICKEIRRGNRDAILEIYHRFHLFFQRLAQKQMGSMEDTDDLLGNFWLELLNGNAICAYEGMNNAALRSYLAKILLLRIIDLQRKIKKQEKRFVSPFVQENGREEEAFSKSTMTPDSGGQRSILSEISDSAQSPDDLIMQKQRSRMFQNALLLLHELSPADARYIRQRMEGLTYEEMALADTDKSDPQSVHKKADAIKKQYTRPKTGSLAKFRIILENLMNENRMTKQDLL